MNFRLLSRLLGLICLLIGGAMVFCLPWAHPALGYRNHLEQTPTNFEFRGFLALLASIAVSGLVGGVLMWLGRGGKKDVIHRKEAMAIVGLSWVAATILGALPYRYANVHRDAQTRMTWADCLFESQSGFSTTGATVISDLESFALVPHCILFWRSVTHFLGGLGIIVLFVVILGQGSAGKALMRAEMPGPTKEGVTPRMQDTAWQFAWMYCALNAALALILWLMGLSAFDALCHAFGTMATGGFSTYNASLGHFQSSQIEYLVILFMLMAGTNFTLLYCLLYFQPKILVKDREWRTYMGVIAIVTLLVVAVGWQTQSEGFTQKGDAFRNGLFQVVSIVTTTGYGTNDFDQWGQLGRLSLLLLMFVGGCAGSTGGGMKVIRHLLFFKILRLEIEHSYRPSVVRPLRLAGRPVDDPDLRKNILVYFALIMILSAASWLVLVAIEPSSTWGNGSSNQLIDSASAVAATLNNIGPGLGVVGATQNYGGFSDASKLLFVWLMMLGRLELFPILVLAAPRFWRSLS